MPTDGRGIGRLIFFMKCGVRTCSSNTFMGAMTTLPLGTVTNTAVHPRCSSVTPRLLGISARADLIKREFHPAVATRLRSTWPTTWVEAAHRTHGTPVLQTARCLSKTVFGCFFGSHPADLGGGGAVGSEFGAFFKRPPAPSPVHTPQMNWPPKAEFYW